MTVRFLYRTQVLEAVSEFAIYFQFNVQHFQFSFKEENRMIFILLHMYTLHITISIFHTLRIQKYPSFYV